MKSISRAFLVLCPLVGPGVGPALAKDTTTQSFSLSELGFRFPSTAPDNIGVNSLRNGMNVDTIKSDLTLGSVKVEVTNEYVLGSFTGTVNGTTYTVTAPIEKREIRSRGEASNSHSDYSDVDPDTDYQTTAVTLWADKYIERMALEVVWSDRHQLGRSFDAISKKVRGDYGKMWFPSEDPLKLGY